MAGRGGKVVYVDNGTTKVIRGYVEKEDDFSYTIKCFGDGAVITIGKAALVKVEWGAE